MPLDTNLGTSCRALAARMVSRRTVVQGLAAGAVVGCTDGGGLQGEALPGAADVVSQVDGLLTTDDSGGHIKSVDEPHLHLLRRISFGPTPESLERLKAMGQTAYVEEQLTLRDDAVELDVQTRYPLTQSPSQTIYATTVIGGQPYWLHTRQYGWPPMTVVA